jgi:aspartyl-tRNA(Asn)/glutamyl-tRNA(Gln) amidotransferase subunit A
VEDAALLLSVMAGADRRDATCAELPVPDYGALLERPLESLRLGLPRQYAGPDNHPDVEAAVRGAAEVMERLGATIVPVDLPLTGHAISTYYILSSAEASSNLARFDSIRYGRRARDVGENLHELYGRSRSEGFGAEVKRRIMLGTYTLSAGYFDAYYRRALSVRRLIKREFDAVFARCHAILGPSAPTAAFALGARSDPLSMYLCDVYTTPGSIAGLCAISLPAGLDAGGMPIGVQIQCQAFDETTMFRVARMFQGATAHHLRRPPSAAGVTAS